jgi:glycerol-3-phosphate dehydrogenase
VFAGLLPEDGENIGPEVALERSPQVIDHAEEGARGLVSIIGVKWTTARAVAERAARLACQRLLRPEKPLAARRLWPSLAPLDKRAPGPGSDLEPETLAHVEELYGPSRDSLLALMGEDPPLSARIVPDLPVMMGQVAHAVRAEMAMRLADVVRRRTPLYLSKALDRSALNVCAVVLARELRWTRRELGTQIDDVEAEMAAFRGPLSADLRPVAA